jgi:hypothetical protein
MIATNILVVQCDGCGHKDIFTATPSSHAATTAYLSISQQELAREGWVEKNLGDGPEHFCPNCKEKLR